MLSSPVPDLVSEQERLRSARIITTIRVNEQPPERLSFARETNTTTPRVESGGSML
ncbi:MAG TPA: hypothetical protein VK363_13575 [Pyrinomonadaceae bacterium]|nr:hypothetical protein [Pyrinomonadaceae bacterium]